MTSAPSGPSPPNPFTMSPSQSGSNTPIRPSTPAKPNPDTAGDSASTPSHDKPEASAKPGSGSDMSKLNSPRPEVPSKSPTNPGFPRKSSSIVSGTSSASSLPPPTHRASFPDASKEPKRGASRLSGPPTKDGYCCERDREIAKGEEISIIDAFKTTEGGTASYITYVIQLGSHTCRRRYSSFLSLHQALTGLYPVLIIPPIPSKQSLTDYAVKGQSKAKEDATVIARRKRLLEDFLRRLVRHPILGGEHVLHRFLEDGVSWSEVLHSPPVSLLPKNPLHAPSHNPTFQNTEEDSPTASPTTPSSPPTTSYIAHHLLPNPSPNHPLRQPDSRFMDSEIFTEKFQNHFTGTMEKVNRRVVKRWGDRAGDLNELGAVWNGFSLVESGKLGEAVEKVGQAVDAEYLATAALLQAWEQTTTEPLHIYSQFAVLIRSRLSFRHQKHVQYELVQEALDTQKDKLELLEAAEKEARRLDEALDRGSRILNRPDEERRSSDAGDHREFAREREEERDRERDKEERAARANRRGGPSFGLLTAVKHSLSGMMDVDPEATRRANIARCRDNISQLEDSLQASAQDLRYASAMLQADLDRFQRQKVADLRQLAVQLSKVHREWCRQNLEAWQAAQGAIRDIEPHPNQPPPEAQQPELPPKIQIDSPEQQFASLSQSNNDFPPESKPQDNPNDPQPLEMGGSGPGTIRNEIERIEAANKPLPLPQGEGMDETFKAEEEEPIRSSSDSKSKKKGQKGGNEDVSGAGADKEDTLGPL